MYKVACRKTNEEGWEEVSLGELDTLKCKIYSALQRVANENMDKIMKTREGKDIEVYLNKMSGITAKEVNEAFMKKWSPEK